MNIRLIQIGQCRCSPVTWSIEIKKINKKYCLPSNHHSKRLVMESLADGKQRCIKKKEKKSVRLCKLCRQSTVSQPSHGECAERELRFDHLSGLTDSVCLCVCVWVICGCWVGGAEESVLLTQAYCGDKGEISAYNMVSARATSYCTIKACFVGALGKMKVKYQSEFAL